MNGPLKELRVKNFLCYRKGVFTFHPGVNMIIGPTDKGKSAIMDAFYKLAFNRPMDNDFVSWWGGDTEIELLVDEWSIKYWKNKSTAGYLIKGDGQTFDLSPIGRSVPDEITRILNISADLNIQRQLERKAPIFLLSETPGDAARLLNNLAGLGGIDSIIKTAKDDINQTSRSKKAIEKQIKEKDEELRQYKGIDKLGKLIAQAEKLQDKVTYCDSMIDNLFMRRGTLLVRMKELEEVRTKLGIIDKYHEMEDIFNSFKEVLKRLDRLNDAYLAMKKNKKRLKVLKNKLRLKPLVNRVIQFSRISDDCRVRRQAIQTSLRQIGSTRDKIFTLRKGKVKKQKIFKELFPDICPLCLSRVDKEHLCK